MKVTEIESILVLGDYCPVVGGGGGKTFIGVELRVVVGVGFLKFWLDILTTVLVTGMSRMWPLSGRNILVVGM